MYNITKTVYARGSILNKQEIFKLPNQIFSFSKISQLKSYIFAPLYSNRNKMSKN